MSQGGWGNPLHAAAPEGGVAPLPTHFASRRARRLQPLPSVEPPHRRVHAPVPGATTSAEGGFAPVKLIIALLVAGVLTLGLGPAAPRRPVRSPQMAATTVSPPPATAVPTVYWYEGYTEQAPAPVAPPATGHPGVTAASGYLVVPTVLSADRIGSAIWLGVEGQYSPQLVQAGIWAQPPGGGADQAWVATCGTCLGTMAPAADTVRPGDHMFFSVTWSPSRWNVVVKNLTAGWTWAPKVSYPPITEGSAVVALEYGPVRFARGGFRWWWPTFTWRGRTMPARPNGQMPGGGAQGCLRLSPPAAYGPIVFRDCPARPRSQ